MVPTLCKTAVPAALLAGPIGVAATAAPFPRPSAPETALSGENPALTETWCDRRAVVAATRRDDFAEEPPLAALTGTGMTMELWASDLLGSWTLVHHGGDGFSCILASGMDWKPRSRAGVPTDRAPAETVHQS